MLIYLAFRFEALLLASWHLDCLGQILFIYLFMDIFTKLLNSTFGTQKDKTMNMHRFECIWIEVNGAQSLGRLIDVTFHFLSHIKVKPRWLLLYGRTHITLMDTHTHTHRALFLPVKWHKSSECLFKNL